MNENLEQITNAIRNQILTTQKQYCDQYQIKPLATIKTKWGN